MGSGGYDYGWVGDPIVTNDQGEYRIPRVADGKYIIQIVKNTDFGWTALTRRDIRINAGESKVHQDFVLVKGAIIHARVVKGDTGEVYPEGRLDVIERDPDYFFNAMQAGPDGRYMLRVPPGFYYVQLNGYPPDGYTGEMKYHQFASPYTGLKVEEGQDVSVDVTLPVKPGKPVSGKVIDATGKPMPH